MSIERLVNNAAASGVASSGSDSKKRKEPIAEPNDSDDDDVDIFDVETRRAALRANRTRSALSGRPKQARMLCELTEKLKQASSMNEELDLIQQLQKSLSAYKLRMSDRYMEELRASAVDYFRLPVVNESTGERLRPSIILCDPPWFYENGTHEVGTRDEYDTMSDARIAAMPVGGLAAEDAILLMWATMPKLHAALRTLESWGFKYNTVFMVWMKVQKYMGRAFGRPGSYTMGCTELVLVATRGKMHPKLRRKGFGRTNALLARPSDHSRKPQVLRKIAVELFGDLPRIELFCRRSGSDWYAWGNQSDQAEGRVDTTPESDKHACFNRDVSATTSATSTASKEKGDGAKRTRKIVSNRNELDQYTSHNCLTSGEVVFFSASPTEAAAGAADDRDVRGDRDDDENNNDDFDAYQHNLIDMYTRNGRLEDSTRRRRHPLYITLSEGQVRDNLPQIRHEHLLNADRMFAYTYAQKKKKRTRLSLPDEL